MRDDDPPTNTCRTLPSPPARRVRHAAVAIVVAAIGIGVFALGHVISGHTLKHLAAAAGLACVAAMLRKRGCRLVP